MFIPLRSWTSLVDTIKKRNMFAYIQTNVEGPSCSSCKSGTFDLNAANKDGCLACFCMGVTQQCTSSNLYRDAVSLVYCSRLVVSLSGVKIRENIAIIFYWLLVNLSINWTWTVLATRLGVQQTQLTTADVRKVDWGSVGGFNENLESMYIIFYWMDYQWHRQVIISDSC